MSELTAHVGSARDMGRRFANAFEREAAGEDFEERHVTFLSAPNVKKLTGRDGYRLRVGGWRVLYEINDGKLVIVVLAIKPRGGAYE